MSITTKTIAANYSIIKNEINELGAKVNSQIFGSYRNQAQVFAIYKKITANLEAIDTLRDSIKGRVNDLSSQPKTDKRAQLIADLNSESQELFYLKADLTALID